MFCSYLSRMFPWKWLQIVHSSGPSALRLKIRSHLRHQGCFKKICSSNFKKIPKILSQTCENIPLIRTALGIQRVITGGKDKSSPLGTFQPRVKIFNRLILTVVVWSDNSPEFSHYHLEL